MLIIASLLILVSNAVTQRRDKSVLYSRIATVALINCLILSLNGLDFNLYSKSLGIFSNLLQTTIITHVFIIFIFFITIIILGLTSFYPRKISIESYSSFYKLLTSNIKYYNSFVLNKMAEQYKILEYPLIILFVVIGGVLLMSTSDLITLFLAIELQSYGLYILCVIYRDSEGATSGGLTYFLLGGLSSCFILLASALLYGNSGNTGFDGLYVINSISTINSDFNLNITTGDSVKSIYDIFESNYLNYSLIIMSTGFLFKISAAPFHFWSPDVYDAIPTVVTTFVSTFAKISILILILELVYYTNNMLDTDNIIQQEESIYYSWTFTLLFSSLLSLIVGAVLGLTQFKIKRLYAYSTISHIGFILLALSINTIESVQSFLFYLTQYSITNVNAFIIIIAIGYTFYFYVLEKDIELTYDKINSKNSPVQYISQLKGYFYINPFIALSLAITLFSFVGIPPLLGFFAKQMVLSSALDKGYVFMVIIGILTSAVSAYYYLAIVKEMYFNKSDYKINPVLNNLKINAQVVNNNNYKSEKIVLGIEDIKLSSSISITISILTLIILLFMLTPQEWLNIATIMALTLFNY